MRTDVENVSGGGVEDTFTGSGDCQHARRRHRRGLRRRAARARRAARRGLRGRGPGARRPARRGRLRAEHRLRDRGPDGPREALRAQRLRARQPDASGRDVVVSPAAKGVEFGPPESSRTVPLLDRIQVPVASFVDSTRGRREADARAAAAARAVGDSYRGASSASSSAARRRPVTDLSLKGGNFRQCRRRDGPRRRRRPRSSAGGPIRRLRARARGRFRTRGRHSSATVRGTIFTIADRCDGTLTRVQRGVVVVRDFRLPAHHRRARRARATWRGSRRRRRRSADMRGCSVAADGIRTHDDLHDAAGAVVSNFVLK